MLFNSFAFFVFLPIVFFLHWKVFNKKKQFQNLFLLAASYFFYGLWDWRFLFLIVASTLVDFYIGQHIYKSNSLNQRKKLLWFSIIFNIGILFFFKYYNFFIDSWVSLFHIFGIELKNTWTLKVILPVGISFYTFQTLSYSLDVYHKKITPTTNFISFATFVSFFPQLVAGPIEKASNLLPQITQKRTFNYTKCTEGLKLILWGLFKKVVIADAIAPIVDDIFQNYANYSSSTLLLGIILFSFQIYGDFSGYSDMAIGTAKLFGIELISNFKFPYLSRNISEFWQRWHISLSNWFKEYVYFPLGGSQYGLTKSIRNISIVFLISGFWHGANWTFIVWGSIHALLYIPIFYTKNNRKYSNTIVAQTTLLPSAKETINIITTFSLVSLSWVFFRAQSITEAFGYLKQVFTNFSFEIYQHPSGYRMIDYYLILILFIIYEFRIRKNERAPFNFSPKALRFILYTLIIFCLVLFFDDQTDRSFIYFQF
ncbi:MBOAT family O-acyltransferase [Aquimarina agarilytica]|uniref:MBOAT family O-acyltransferase n=1 Tax=Aquimarina agarilytica TaxID=1087449 RepID=UPI000287B0D3|nr:MBOAT family O-acyltransferase [Aquimarina agarilytica]